MIEGRPRWDEIEELFFGALGLPENERDAWIHQSAEGSPDLEAEVRSLLAAHENANEHAAPNLAGPYRLERLIGSGGMGEVWLASRADGQFEQQVAVKVVRSGLPSGQLFAFFRRERQLLARLNHPNITRLLDGGITPEGRPYLAMEYVEGEPILEYAEHHRLDTGARLKLFRTLCSAVEYAHRNLIVHRDIKPGNVLVTVDGSPKLLDFGTARLTEGGTQAATRLPMLTLRYASPEQLRGEQVTTASDVYSLAVLLFELLTGSLPYSFASDDLTEVVAAISTREPARASSVRRNGVPALAPGDLDAILAKALDKDPERRYPSVDRLSADIANYLAGRPVAARPLTAAYRVKKYVRRHWIGVSMVLAVAFALALAAGLSVRAARVANQERLRTERVTRFLEDTLGSAEPFGQGATPRSSAGMRLVDLLPSASQKIGEVFAKDPVAQARLHTVIGYVYTRLGEFPRAEAEIQAARDRLPALSDHPVERAKLLFAAGLLDFRLSHYREEEQELRQAVDLCERTPELRDDVPLHTAYLSTLAAVLADVRKKDEARAAAGRAERLMARPSGVTPGERGAIEDELALVYTKVGDLAAARSSAITSVAALSTTPGTLVSQAEALGVLGFAERGLGHPAAALSAYQQARDDVVETLGPDDPLDLPVRIELAYQKALDGQPGQVLEELNRCLVQARSRSNVEDLFHALHSYGYVLTLAGQPRRGETLIREALRVGAAILSPAGPSMGICKGELAECLARQRRLSEALPLAQTAYDNLNSYYGPDAWFTRHAKALLDRVKAGAP